MAWKSSRAREHEPDGPPQRERRAGRERLDERELAAERASERLRDDADRARAEGRTRGRARCRVTNEPCVLVETTSVPDGSSQAVQTCGSMYAW